MKISSRTLQQVTLKRGSSRATGSPVCREEIAEVQPQHEPAMALSNHLGHLSSVSFLSESTQVHRVQLLSSRLASTLGHHIGSVLHVKNDTGLWHEGYTDKCIYAIFETSFRIQALVQLI